MAYREEMKIIFKDGTQKTYYNIYVKAGTSGFYISKSSNFSNEDYYPYGMIDKSACKEANPGSGGCFISTAVCQFQSNPNKSLNVLRDFRDNTMQTKPITNKMIEFYYHISPPIAEYLCTNKKQSLFIKKYFIDNSVNLIRKMNDTKKSEGRFLSWVYELCVYGVYSLGILVSWVMFKIGR